jgi:hypothetical protein
MVAKIVTGKGQEILVDDEDFEWLSGFSWCKSHEYAVRSYPKEFMHRMIFGLKPGDKRMVDHVNGNGMDNRRENLRLCDHAGNGHNTGRRSTNTSGFKGVTWDKARRRWKAHIRHDAKKINLGRFDCPKEAHEVYCLAADMLHGEFANHG